MTVANDWSSYAAAVMSLQTVKWCNYSIKKKKRHDMTWHSEISTFTVLVNHEDLTLVSKATVLFHTHTHTHKMRDY